MLISESERNAGCADSLCCPRCSESAIYNRFTRHSAINPFCGCTMDEAIHANETATNHAAIEDYENRREATGGDASVGGDGARSINGNTVRSGKGNKRHRTNESGSDADGSDDMST